MSRWPESAEGSVARWAAIALSTSALVPVVFFGVLLGANQKDWALIAPCAVVAALYFAQIAYLSRIERYRAQARKRIWVTSLWLHAAVLVPILVYFARERIPLGVLVLVAPEVMSAALHVRGLRLSSNALEIA